MMDLKLKVATATTAMAMTVAAVALTIAPVGALHIGGRPPMQLPTDDFAASNMTLTEVKEKNYVTVQAGGEQVAASGNVKAGGIDDIKGNIVTGSAANAATSGVTVTTSNSATAPVVAAPAVPATDLSEFDNVTLANFTKTELYSKNVVTVTNSVGQTAATGSVDLHCMDDAAGITTGNAANSATLTTTVTTSN